MPWAGSPGRSDEHLVACPVANLLFARSVRGRGVSGQAHHPSFSGSQMTVAAVVGYCFSAFGLGYAGGAIQRIIRRAVETLD